MLEPAKIIAPIAKTPDLAGVAKAWRCDLAELARTFGEGKEHAMLDIWLVEAPWAHPVWHSYRIVLIHLREMPDRCATKFYLEGASHELWVDALDPGETRIPLLEGKGPAHYLEPSNFAAQFIEPTDIAARERVERAVAAICAGTLNPDTDALRQWVHLFGDNMLKKPFSGAVH